MKKYFIILLGITCLCFTKSNNDFDIVGKWKSKDKSGKVIITFDEKGYAVFESKKRKIGGQEFYSDNGRKFSLEYKVSLDEIPYQLDLIFTDFKSGKQKIDKCIFKVESKNKIWFSRGENGKRPVNFITDSMIILKRM